MAARPRRLFTEGLPLRSIQANPRGAMIEFDSAEHRTTERSLVPGWPNDPRRPRPDDAGRETLGALDQHLDALASESRCARICPLVWGLDSSGAALRPRPFLDAHSSRRSRLPQRVLCVSANRSSAGAEM